MGKYRPVYTKIWNDPDFQEYPPDKKLLFLYLCTNPYTTESGIYPITLRTISNDTGMGFETVGNMLSNGNLKNVFYDHSHKHVFVKNLKRYNPGGKPELVRRSISEDLNCSKDCIDLWNIFFESYPEYREVRPDDFPHTPLDRNLPNLTTTNTIVTNDPINNGSATVGTERKRELTVQQPLDNGNKTVTDNVYKAYEQNIGILTPVVCENIKVYTEQYTDIWVISAIEESAKQNKRSWSYVEGILKRWSVDGFKVDTRKTKNNKLQNQPSTPFIGKSPDEVLG